MILREVPNVVSVRVIGTRQTKTEVGLNYGTIEAAQGLLKPTEGRCRPRQGSKAQSGMADRLKGIRGHVSAYSNRHTSSFTLGPNLPQ
jgi:hypothetical protein